MNTPTTGQDEQSKQVDAMAVANLEAIALNRRIRDQINARRAAQDAANQCAAMNLQVNVQDPYFPKGPYQ